MSKIEVMANYEHLFVQAGKFLSSSAKKANRKSWTLEQKKNMINLNALCTTCNEKLTLKNITREHIFPLILGGRETEDNVIAMCDSCNDARNQVMAKVIGSTKLSDIRAIWPKKKNEVCEFITWSCVTVSNNDFDSSVFVELENMFLQIREPKVTKTQANQPKGIKERFRNLKESIFGKKDDNKKVNESKDCACLNPRCNVVLLIPVNSKNTYRCPPQKGGCGKAYPAVSLLRGKDLHAEELKERNSQNKKPIFDLSGWLKDYWNGLEDAKESYVALKVSIAKHEKNNLGRPVREMLETDFGLKKSLSLNVMYNKLNDLYQQAFPTKEIITKKENSTRKEEKIPQNANVKSEFIQAVLEKLEGSEELLLSKLFVPWKASLLDQKGYKSWNEIKKKMGYSNNTKLATIIEELLGKQVKITRKGTIATISIGEKNNKHRLRNEFIEVVNEKLKGVEKLHINNLFSPWNSTAWHDSGFKGWKEFKIAMGYSHSSSLTSIVEELVGDRVSIIHEGTTVYISFK